MKQKRKHDPILYTGVQGPSALDVSCWIMRHAAYNLKQCCQQIRMMPGGWAMAHTVPIRESELAYAEQQQ